MKKTGVFYGSSTGTCEELANQIAEKLGVSSTDVHSVDKMTADKIKEYEVLVLGPPLGETANCRATGMTA